MSALKINTTQNVEIEYEPASVGTRIVASIIDYIILFILIISIVIFAGVSSILPSGQNTNFLTRLPLYLFLLFVFLYDLVCEIFMNGQSFGKKIMKIKVIKIDGTQPSIGSYLLRWILRLIDMGVSYGSVALTVVLINGKGQRLGDIAADTTVVSLKKRVSFRDTIYKDIDAEYNPTFPEAEHLDEKIISIINEVLEFSDKNENLKKVEEILERTKAKIVGIFGKENDMNPKKFLLTVLKDYNYFHGRL